MCIRDSGIAATIQLLLMNLDPVTGGGRGMPGVPRPFAFLPPLGFAAIYLAMAGGAMILSYVALERLVRSPWGRVLRAIRDDEAAAASLGKSVEGFRLTAFVIGAAFMGLAGALYASFIGYVSPFDFLPIMTFQVWAMLIVGGSGSNRGAIVGAFLVWALWSLSGVTVVSFLPTRLQTQGGAIQAIMIGTLLIATLILRPNGLIGSDQRPGALTRLKLRSLKQNGRRT